MSNYRMVVLCTLVTWVFALAAGAQVTPVSGYVAPWIEMKPVASVSNSAPSVAAITIRVDRTTLVGALIAGLNSRADLTRNSTIVINGFSVTLAQINNVNAALSGISGLAYNTQLLLDVIAGLNGKSAVITNTGVRAEALSAQSQALVLLAEYIGSLNGTTDKTELFTYVVNSLNGSSTLISADKLVFSALSAQGRALVLLAESIGRLDGGVAKTELYALLVGSLNGQSADTVVDAAVFQALSAQGQALVLLAASVGRIDAVVNRTELFNYIVAGLSGSSSLISADKLVFSALTAESRGLVLVAEAVGALPGRADKLAFYSGLLAALNGTAFVTKDTPGVYSALTSMLGNQTIVQLLIVPVMEARTGHVELGVLVQVARIQAQYRMTVVELERLVGILARASALTTDKVSIQRLSATVAGTANQQPVIMHIGSTVVMVAYNYVFSWYADKAVLFPEIAERRAQHDTYFGSLEREIAAACESEDYAEAERLAKQYVAEWAIYNRKPIDTKHY
jgi:hypothetical protein